MKSLPLCLFIILLTGCSSRPSDAVIKKVIKAKVEEMNTAMLTNDFAKIVALTHPNVFKLASREDTIEYVKTTFNKMKSEGISFLSGKVGEPSDLITKGNDLFVVVPYSIEMSAPRGIFHQNSFVIGVSSDQGKTWHFISGDLPLKTIKDVLPNLPNTLLLPERQKPVFEKTPPTTVPSKN